MIGFEQPPLRSVSLSLVDGELAVSGSRTVVPPQVRPGQRCLRSGCPKNTDLVCGADLSGERGALAPFRPLCPEAAR